MKAKYSILVSILTVFVLIACETTEKIDDFPLRPSKLVVNSFFSDSREWEIQVSKSLSVLDNADLKLIEDATVNIYKGTELIATITRPGSGGLYRAGEILPEMGQEYSIEVSSPSFPDVATSSDIVPLQVQVTSVSAVITEADYYEWTSSNGTHYYGGNAEGNFGVLFSDPPEVDNYYQLLVAYYDTVYQEPDSLEFTIDRRMLWVSSDDGAVGQNGNDIMSLLFSDEVFNGLDYKLKVNFTDRNARKGRKYFIELVSLSEAGYLYRMSGNEFGRARNDPFAEPVQVYCNIENGYGIFAAYSVDIYEIVLEEGPL